MNKQQAAATTGAGLEAQLVRVVDRAAIHDLVSAYAHARDTTDPALYREIFTEDAVIAAGSGRVLSADREQILAKVSNDRIRFNPGSLEALAGGAERPYGIMRHLVTNVRVTIDGDAARSSYYVSTVAYNEREKRPELISTARNDDRYARRDGRWWIVRSTLHFGWEHDEMGRALQVGPHTPPQYRT